MPFEMPFIIQDIGLSLSEEEYPCWDPNPYGLTSGVWSKASYNISGSTVCTPVFW